MMDQTVFLAMMLLSDYSTLHNVLYIYLYLSYR